MGNFSSSPQRNEIVQSIVDDYAARIRAAREHLNLTQEAFAKKLSEKVSIIQKIEAGNFKPSIKTARKLEKTLKISLVDQVEDSNIPFKQESSSSEGLTMADFIKKK